MLGEVLSDYSGKITSVKVLPFDNAEPGVKYEVTQVGEFRGRLSCQGMGSNYVQVAPDGTSTTKFYGVFTTPDGETLLMESGGMGVPLGAGRVKFRTTVTLKSAAAKLTWVNTTPIAFEGEGDFSTMEVKGTLYEWK
ncbi:MAG: hypothetical protein AB7G75_14480 [Candidatus Binatia bacterium]